MKQGKEPKAKAPQNKDGTRTAASIVVYDTELMSPAGARKIANWLEKQAKFLRDAKSRKALSGIFRARYLFGSVTKK